MKLPTTPVQKPVDNLRTSCCEPTSAPDFAMLAKFQPEPWEPVSPRKEWLILVGSWLFVALEAYVIYWMLT